MTRQRLILVMALVALHLAGSWWLGQRDMLAGQQRKAEALSRELNRIIPLSGHRQFGMGLAKTLLARFRGTVPPPATIEHLRQQIDRQFGPGAIQIALLNASETPLVASPDSSPEQKILRKMLAGGWLATYGLRVPRWRNDRIRSSPQYQGIWHSDATVASGTAQVLLILDLRRFTQDRLFRLTIERLRARGLNVGLYDRLLPHRSTLPRGVQADDVTGHFSQGGGGVDATIGHGADLLLLLPRLGTTIFLGLVQAGSVTFPAWTIGLLFVWLIPLLAAGFRGSERPTISLFLAGTFGLAAGIPLLMTLVFWSVFQENRVANVTATLLASMEAHLIETENNFLPFLRRREVQYRNLFAHLEHGLQSGGEIASQAEHRVARLELINVLDHLWLIDIKGRHLRDYCALTPPMRRLLPYSPASRLRRMQKLLTLGYDLEEREVELALKMTIEVSSLPLYWTFRVTPEVYRRVMDGVGAVGRELLRRHNDRTGGGSQAGEDRSSLVTGSMIESQTGDLMRNVFSTLGRFIRAGSGMVQSRAFLDILRDREGHGTHCGFIFTDLRSLENAFLDRLMADRSRWPSGLRYFSESAFGFAVFPDSLPYRGFRFLDDALTPPRRLFSRVMTLNGRKSLVAALAGRHLLNYFLIGVRSWDEVEAHTRDLQRQLAMIGLLMGLLICVIVLRLRSTVIRPAAALQEGVRAMERKDFEHRIPLMTGDEWDELATAFNRTLEGMEELEVTRVLRTRLLPAGPITGAGGVFQGRSLTSGDVGGDYFDAVARPDGGFAFIVGDAPGSGVSAALVTAMVKSAFLILVRSGVSSPANLLDRLNRLLLNHLSKRQSMSCMAGFAEVDGKVTVAGAGFRDPRIIRHHRRPETVKLGGNPLGLSAETVYDNRDLSLGADGMLIMTTAGVTEALSPEGEAFGAARLDAVLRSVSGLPVERLVEGVQGAWVRHTGTGRWTDDATLAVFSRAIATEPEAAKGPPKPA